MSDDFKNSSLWRRTLGTEDEDGWAEQRSALRAAYLQFRTVVEPLASEIARTMPMFTDHSINHIDSLWDTASLLLGDDFPVNPAEAFVLGGAFLLHDLGMGLASFPDGSDSLRADPLFSDLQELAKTAIREADAAVSEEVLDSASADEATVTILRLRHARQAERLVNQVFRTSAGQEFRLLQDTALRSAFGPLIGKIAHSHWFDVDQLYGAFPQVIGSHPQHPTEWYVDPLKIACILRLADAAHIDSRRAPTYLHAFRRPTGTSKDHWYFQERLTRPRLNGDRLEYTSGQPFETDEAGAWWLAYETVQTVDRELRKVDALCADLGRARFPCKAVAGAESPDRFSRYVPTAGWQPIDARLRVSQVSEVISRLGGKELYGNRPEVAVRELVANAADATRARIAQYGVGDSGVTVRLEQIEGSFWLTVEDKGIGMSPSVLVSALTDFGKSRWQSQEMVSEYPGLLTRGFKATGKFGIGFFSTFMVADHVEVSSLKYADASANTHVLVFENGLRSRPLLRVAEPHEFLLAGGTRVRARLKDDPLSEDGLFQSEILYQSRSEMFRYLVTMLCALADVDIHVQGPEDDSPSKVVEASDWKWLPPRELFARIYRGPDEGPITKSMNDAYEDVFAEYVQNLYDSGGDIIGRALLAAGLETAVLKDLWWWPSPQAEVFVGGFHADSISDCLGVFCGSPLKADRFSAFPLATVDELRQWAESQAELVRRSRYATATLQVWGR